MARLIVSCTTTRARLRFLYYMLESLKAQTVQPDLVLVNLSSNAYLADDGVKEIPAWLNGENVEVNWVANTGPYRKLIPVVEYTKDEDMIVTADDDILYHEDWLKKLVERAEEHPETVVCARARYMRRTFYGGWQNYQMWPLVDELARGLDILPTGGAGAVYRKELLDTKFLKDDEYLRLAPTSDDLWFRMASYRIGVKVTVDPGIDAGNIYLKHGCGLAKDNLHKSKSLIEKARTYSWGLVRGMIGWPETENDLAWRRIVRYSGSAEGLEK